MPPNMTSEELDQLMTPGDFNQLKKPDMTEHLKTVGLKSSGNMPDLRDRYKNWYNSPSDDTASAGPSTDPAPADLSATTVLDPTVATTVPLLERLFLNNKKTRVSQVILDVIQKLEYTPGQSYRAKTVQKDLSELLGPIGLFTDTFLRVLNNMVLDTKASRNLVSVRINMKKQIPKIVADTQLVPFFAAWDITVISSSKSPSPPPDDEARQVQMAMQVSLVSAEAEAARRDAEDDEDEMLLDAPLDTVDVTAAAATAHAEAEKSRKVILQELDIVNSAIAHRLARWTRDFPKPSHSELLWPNSFNQAERKQIKKHIRDYIDDKNLWLKDLDAEEQGEAIDELKDDPNWPIEYARNAGVIQSCFLDLRKDKKRWSESPSTSASRTPSPAKQSVENLDDDADEEGGSGGPSTARRVSRGRGSGRGSTRGSSPGRGRGGPRGRPRGTSRGRPAGHGASGPSAGAGPSAAAGKRKASSMVEEDDEDDDDDEDAVVAPTRAKRPRVSGSRLKQSYTAENLEEDDDDHGAAVQEEEDDEDDGDFAA